ncbi:hypothetical protein [Helicobacter sp. 23-1046]
MALKKSNLIDSVSTSDIQSAGLSRIYQHTQNYQCGSISAFRQYRDGWENESEMMRKNPKVIKEYKIPYNENKDRHKLLGGLLHKMGIDTIEIIGNYIEAGSGKLAKELSYFCFVDSQKFTLKECLIDLGDRFEQDSITYAKKGENFELVASHTHTDSDGNIWHKGDIIAEFDKGKLFGKTDGKIYSLIRGRPFQWAGWKPTKIQSCKKASDDFYRIYISSLYPTERFIKEIYFENLLPKISTKKGTMKKILANVDKSLFLQNAGF